MLRYGSVCASSFCPINNQSKMAHPSAGYAGIVFPLLKYLYISRSLTGSFLLLSPCHFSGLLSIVLLCKAAALMLDKPIMFEVAKLTPTVEMSTRSQSKQIHLHVGRKCLRPSLEGQSWDWLVSWDPNRKRQVTRNTLPACLTSRNTSGWDSVSILVFASSDV